MKIKIHNFNWDVVFTDDLPESDTVYLGLTEYVVQKISIRKTMSPELQRATIIHELCHAFLFCYGLGRKSFSEEIVCDFFGTHADEIMKLTDKIMQER